MPAQSQTGGGGKPRRNRKPKPKGPVNNAQYAFEYLVHAGMTRAGAAGVVGNLVQESGVNPGSNQSGGPGHGIAQWSEGGRWDTLVAWTQNNGMNPNSLDGQLAYLVHEMKTGYGDVWNTVTSTHSAEQATMAVQNGYEMPNQALANTPHRLGAADAALNGQWRSISSASTPTGGGWPSGQPNNPNGYDRLNPQELAAKYGWAYNFLQSVPELANLFKKANAANWSTAMFTAKLRDTEWFQTHSEDIRQAQYLEKTDPATFQRRLDKLSATIADSAGAMGVALDPAQLARIADHSYMLGLTDAEIQNVLAAHLHMIKGQFSGTAGDTQDQLSQWAQQNGVRLSRDWINNAVQNVAAGNKAVNFYTDHITRMAQSAFPSLKIDANTTVQSLADPYIQSMANMLEIPSASINLYNPRIRQALAHTDPATGKVGTKTMYDFENELRQDPRWLNTQNAHDEFQSATYNLLQQWGLMS